MIKKNKIAYALFFAFAAIFISVVFKGAITAQPGDENVYFYMGKLIAEGKIPYRDFFYAHPPLHAYLLAAVYKAFGFNILALKLIPFVSALISSFFIFKIAKEKFGNLEAITSSLLFMFSYGIMFNSAFSFGIMTATMLMTIGFYFLFNKNKNYLAGLFFGLAAVTRLLALIPIFVILFTVFLSNRKKFVQLSSSFLIIFLAVNLAFILFFGNDYTTPVYKFHLVKSAGINQNLNEYLGIIKLNWILFLSAFAFVFAKSKKPLIVFAVPSLIYLAFLLFLKRLFGFYFIIIFPFLAIIGGYSLANLCKQLRIGNKLKVAAAAAIALIFLWNLAADISFLQKRAFTGFERGNDLADFVNTNSNKNTLLFGDASIAPLIALMTDKKLALDFADTNDQVFSSRIVDINNVLSGIKGKNILFIARDKGISSLTEARNFLNTDCELLSTFYDRSEGNYLIYKCG
ncbi:glycosyltransferase family 39 protein [Candidatus Woesearchaeota archaeon]|nr:glycosyltransferase family 39 protein [Candidatus Woesearchaeota archaeon]